MTVLCGQANIGTSVSVLMPGTTSGRFGQVSNTQALVASAGYSIPQLLQSLGLEVGAVLQPAVMQH